MPIIVAVSETAAGPIEVLGLNTHYYLPSGVTVQSTGDGIDAFENGHELTIAGNLLADHWAIHLGDASGDTGGVINILAGATVANVGGINSAIFIQGTSATINNAGAMVGGIGAYFDGAGSSKSVMSNSGTILADNAAVINFGSAALALTNTGYVKSYSFYSFYSGHTGIDTVINKGTMVGSIFLGAGSDSYDGRGGKVLANVIGGNILGGDGADTLTGGNYVDRMNGGVGSDIITGGLAKDVLTGGADADKFVFNAVAEAGDTISDFTTADFVVVKSSAFGGIAKGTLSAAAFYANTTGVAHDADDRFIYETDVDRLWYDSNGSAVGGTKVLLADFTLDVNMTRGDILVI